MFQILRVLMPLVAKPFIGRLEGLEKIPTRGGAVLVANHASYLDHYVIGTTVAAKRNRRLWFLAKKEHFDKPLHKVVHKMLYAIPLDRETGGKAAMKTAVKKLQEGELIMIYPEGTRTLTGKLNRAKAGAAKLALAAKVPIIPVGLLNTFYILPKGAKVPKIGKRAHMIVGEPMYFEEFYGRENDKEALNEVTRRIMTRVAELIGEEYPY